MFYCAPPIQPKTPQKIYLRPKLANPQEIWEKELYFDPNIKYTFQDLIADAPSNVDRESVTFSFSAYDGEICGYVIANVGEPTSEEIEAYQASLKYADEESERKYQEEIKEYEPKYQQWLIDMANFNMRKAKEDKQKAEELLNFAESELKRLQG